MAQICSQSTTITTTTMFIPKPPPPLCTFLTIILLCILSFYTLHYPSSSSSSSSSTIQRVAHFRQMFLTLSTNSTIATYLRALTLHPHLAGTKPSLETAHYVRTHFKDQGLNTHMVKYQTLLSYPTYASISAYFSNGTRLDLPLNEVGRRSFNRKSGGDIGEDVVQPYHAYSPSGSAYSKAVFVNCGRDEDYRVLGVLGVNVSGCVVVVRKSDFLPRSEVVSKAGAHGAVAVLLYAEEEMKRFRKGFERGTVMKGLGDPLSPGWAAGVDGAERLDLEDSEVLNRFPKIPSMPLSAEAADIILGSLGGPVAPPEWKGNLKSMVSRVGPGPTVVNFTYQGEKKVATIHNVFAVVRGSEEPDRFVLLGNHRDAWTYGAVDPNSGTAALLDLARRFGLMMRSGWNPRRTMILCSWDAEEFGMIGSTEWVEQNLLNLGAKAIAYLNVDCAVQGPGFFAGATPQLDNLLIEVTKKVKDPDSQGSTLYQKSTTTNTDIGIQRLSGSDSDFASFVHHAGVPSIDLYYGRDFPVYHTAFDNYEWMTSYGDPLFRRHVTVAEVWGLVALHLADDSIIPFNYIPYADQLKQYKDDLSNLLHGFVSLSPLITSIQEFSLAAKDAEVEVQRLTVQESTGDFALLKKRALNDRLMLAERGFIDVDGLQGRRWFKHLIYGPPNDHEIEMLFFPGIADAISQSKRMSKKEGQAAIQHEIWRVSRAIQRAAAALKGELS